MGELPLPSHHDPTRVGEIRKVDYEACFADARGWAREHRLHPAHEDVFRTCLLLVDVQNTFCTPGFELFVGGRSGTGALDDNRRLCAFLYRNLDLITRVVATLDTHQAFQVFHASFLVDENGRPPDPFTLVTREDVASRRWRVDPRAAAALGLSLQIAEERLASYVSALAESGKYDLTIWPFHALLGGIGHALVPAVEEAVFFHAIARSAQPSFEIKGTAPLTEHYSAFGPEVAGDAPTEARNAALVELLASFDAVLVAGQAKSHCVAWTVADLLSDPLASSAGIASRLYLLEDCTSPVVVPEVVDYTEEADAAYDRFAQAGAHVVRSTEPVSSWPGVLGSSARAT
jgi:nicotinamidase-related amidase